MEKLQNALLKAAERTTSDSLAKMSEPVLAAIFKGTALVLVGPTAVNALVAEVVYAIFGSFLPVLIGEAAEFSTRLSSLEDRVTRLEANLDNRPNKAEALVQAKLAALLEAEIHGGGAAIQFAQSELHVAVGALEQERLNSQKNADQEHIFRTELLLFLAARALPGGFNKAGACLQICIGLADQINQRLKKELEAAELERLYPLRKMRRVEIVKYFRGEEIPTGRYFEEPEHGFKPAVTRDPDHIQKDLARIGKVLTGLDGLKAAHLESKPQ